jgi:hypothetical protein
MIDTVRSLGTCALSKAQLLHIEFDKFIGFKHESEVLEGNQRTQYCICYKRKEPVLA